MSEEAFARRVTRLGTLADPVRRALYRFVADQPDAVSRDQAADGVDVPRHTAKHHLDKLVAEGLLVTEFRRLTGRTGPGAGRPAKLYRRSPREVGVSIPARRYDMAGGILADAVERALSGVSMPEALDQAVRRAAADAVSRIEVPAESAPVERVAAALAPFGYEPRLEVRASDEAPPGRTDGPEAALDGVLELANCPFGVLAQEHTALVCGLNRVFVGAVAEGLGDGMEAMLDPGAGRCCVRVRRTPS